jgi:ABC-type glutathione transport system ATPase component
VYNNGKNSNLRIPRGKNNADFKLENLNEDQFKVAYVIIRKLKEWVELLKKTERERKQFTPLRMTVVGCAGSGKSILIITVVGYIRKIFQDNNSVILAAPTGAAAHKTKSEIYQKNQRSI